MAHLSHLLAATLRKDRPSHDTLRVCVLMAFRRVGTRLVRVARGGAGGLGCRRRLGDLSVCTHSRFVNAWCLLQAVSLHTLKICECMMFAAGSRSAHTHDL